MIAKVIRWILVLPGAIAALYLAYAVNAATTYFAVGRPESGGLMYAFMHSFFALVSGGAFVYAGIWISPPRSPAVGFVLAGLNVLNMGMLATWALQRQDWATLLETLATAAGAGTTAYLYSREPHFLQAKGVGYGGN